jgi:glycosyltransferase involved in cell wall biosynthesis
MDKLRIGVIIEENCLPTEGGGYSYYQTLLKAINQHSFHPEIEIVNVVFSRSFSKKYPFNKEVITVRKSLLSTISYFIFYQLFRIWFRVLKPGSRTMGESLLKKMDSILNHNAIAALKANNIDLIYYLKPREHIIDYPLILTHWDVGHKSMYPFPEVASNGNYKKREDYYTNALSKAFLILCESVTGRNELLKFYPVNIDKVKVLPIFSGRVSEIQVSHEMQNAILNKYNIVPSRYYLYPAQFWAHKNHYNLVHAFKSLLPEPGNEDLKLVLCGSDQGNLGYIKGLIAEMQLNGKVVFPGFITDEELNVLYRNSVALVMPTFLGPTNLPLIEAASLGCPILCSKLEGHYELLGDTALYFDPANAASIRERMIEILDKNLSKTLAEAAQERMSQSPFNVEKSIALLQEILLQIKPIRKTWGSAARFLLQVAAFPTMLL